MKISLRRWKTEDYIDFYNASNDESLYNNMSDSFPHTLDKCKQTVEAFSKSTDASGSIRAIITDGKITGCIAAFWETDMYCKNAEIAYWLDEAYRGKGIMPQVLTMFTDDIFKAYDIHRIWARPFAYNRASQRALEKAGFTREGVLRQDAFKNNQYMDSVIYALLRDEKTNVVER